MKNLHYLLIVAILLEAIGIGIVIKWGVKQKSLSVPFDHTHHHNYVMLGEYDVDGVQYTQSIKTAHIPTKITIYDGSGPVIVNSYIRPPKVKIEKRRNGSSIFHVRYLITEEIETKVENINGVEYVFSFNSKYQLNVYIGKAFDWEKDGIRQAIMKVLVEGEKNETTNN